MANCFRLLSREDGQPVLLTEIDNRMAEHFGEEPHETKWFRYWYDKAGFSFAMGRTIAETRELFPEDNDILDWIDANFTIDAWAEVGRARA